MVSKKAGSVLNFLDNLAASSTPPADMVVPLDEIGIDPERKQPRRQFDKEALNRLAVAIKEHGLIQPIVVRHSGLASPKYYLVAGERRWRACSIAEKKEAPIYLRDDLSSNAQKQYEVQVIENGNRQSLTDYEFACGLREMITNRKAEHPTERGVKGKVAALAGVSASDLSRYLSLLDDDIEPLASEGIIYNSEHVSMFRKLPEDVRDDLVASARARGTSIAWSELRDALASGAAAGREAQPGAEDLRVAERPTGASAVAAGDVLSAAGLDEMQHDQGLETDSDGQAGDTPLDIGSASGDTESSASQDRGPISTSSGATSGKTIKLSKLSGEKVERLLRFLVDKETDKLDIMLPRDLAVAVLENMGIELPESIEDYATRIKDFLI